MKRGKLLQFSICLSFVICMILSGCEKDPDLAIQPRNYQHSTIRANGPSRIDQTPVRLNTKASVPVNTRHDQAKNSISNIR